METDKTEQKSTEEPICPKCGGPVVQTELLGGTGPLAVTKPRSAISLTFARGSALTARTCTACGYVEVYALNPEVLR